MVSEEKLRIGLTPEETKRFIKMVREHPELYHRKHIKYTDKLLKDSIWGGIGQSFNISGEATRKIWQNLRYAYTTYKRKYKDTNQADKFKSPYKFAFQLMLFLEGSIEKRAQVNNSETVHKIKHVADNPIICGIENVIVNPSFELSLPIRNFLNPGPSPEKMPNPQKVIKAHDSILSHHRKLSKLTINNVKSASDSSTNSMNEMEPVSGKSSANSSDNVEYEENSIPSILKRRRRLDEEQNSSQNNVRTITTKDMGACEQDNTVPYFVQYAMEVLNKLPPNLRIQAKQDMYRVLSKYKQITEMYSSPISSMSQDDSVSSEMGIKIEPSSFNPVAEVKVETNVFDNVLDVGEEFS